MSPAALPLFPFVPWMRIVWLCARPHDVPGAVYPPPGYTKGPYQDAGAMCQICGAPATRSCDVAAPWHEDPAWAWPFAPSLTCRCCTCRPRRGRCHAALLELLGVELHPLFGGVA